jgi:hypothetical protein
LPEYRFTAYFEREVLRKRTYLTKEECVRVVTNPLRTEQQADGRVRFRAESEGRYLRVVTLPDRVTIHNAFLDRRFVP